MNNFDLERIMNRFDVAATEKERAQCIEDVRVLAGKKDLTLFLMEALSEERKEVERTEDRWADSAKEEGYH